MKSNPIAVDTNVLVYLHDSSDERKRVIAENILASNPQIPAQVVSEYINVIRRLLALPKSAIVKQCAALLEECEIIPISCGTLVYAVTLIEKYNFQIFDSIIVAAAVGNGCTTLYSEDMQHGLIINDLRILNLFKI